APPPWAPRRRGRGRRPSPPRPPGTGSRRGRAGRPGGSGVGRGVARGRAGDPAAELERLLLIVVQFLPRLAAGVRLRAADERLGAWATGLADPQDPVVAAARERAAAVQRAPAAARGARAAHT